MTIRRSFIVLIAALLTLLAILAGATSADAQIITEPQPCLQIDGATLLHERLVYPETRCVYATNLKVTPSIFCVLNAPEGMYAIEAFYNANNNIKCVFTLGAGPHEYRHAPAGFRFSN